MLQLRPDPGTFPENYVLKGLNTRYNYHVGKNNIFDLEYNLPI